MLNYFDKQNYFDVKLYLSFFSRNDVLMLKTGASDLILNWWIT